MRANLCGDSCLAWREQASGKRSGGDTKKRAAIHLKKNTAKSASRPRGADPSARGDMPYFCSTRRLARASRDDEAHNLMEGAKTINAGAIC